MRNSHNKIVSIRFAFFIKFDFFLINCCVFVFVAYDIIYRTQKIDREFACVIDIEILLFR